MKSKGKDNTMKYLNEITGFEWASAPIPEGFAKVCLCHEAFWIKDCKEENGLWTGTVDNMLICTEDHGLLYGDTVSFTVTEIE